MDGITLHRLGRQLTDLAADVVRASRPDDYTPGEKAVLSQLLRAPGSTAADLVRTTGFTQSHVSASVARLRDRDLVTATADPADARRQLLSLTATARRGLRRRLDAPADAALARALGADRARRAEHLLTELAALLSTDVPAGDPPL